MKIYTRRGDSGETDLFGGGRVPKNDLRMSSIGAVDELNAVLGEVLAIGNPLAEPDIRGMILEIQRDLFVLGADLATVKKIAYKGRGDVPRIGEVRVKELESLIDSLDAVLAPMNSFILPGGCVSAAKLHFARTVCRRTERICVRLSLKENLKGGVIQYLNRLSDLLFVMARYENFKKSVPEEKWLP